KSSVILVGLGQLLEPLSEMEMISKTTKEQEPLRKLFTQVNDICREAVAEARKVLLSMKK
ncbi:MAG TPA: hypothetical protein VK750_09255, partial [Cytophagaceae bacterium]|nr:hypothetical protein [Cytophagaceae bacterium]